ncbi:MAG: sodium-dependent transporter [Bacteroidetes bacterium]|nr:MAG: sodium-dependent transporter [Bacteroidota bacterium]
MSTGTGGNRDGFTSKFGIVAAAAGSAIGLGNIWRFPYVVGESGGGAFLLVYLSFVLLLGIPVMLSEFIIGRKAKRNTFGAFREIAPKTWWPIIGVMGIVAAFVILAFYSTIAGWTLHYVYLSFSNGFQGRDTAELTHMFELFQTSTFLPLFWQLIFITLTAAIILSGVKKGIEKYSKILMPFLLLLLITLSIRSVTLPGSFEGLVFLFKPDFGKLDSGVILGALGQAFFSLSIGMGALITYSSYFPDRTNLSNTAFEVSVADVIIAILAGIAIFPAMFSIGMLPEQGGAGLIFMVLPNVFLQIPGGYFISIAFFILLAIAALTSSISIMEVVVAFLTEEFNIKRKYATLVTAVSAAFVGLFCTLSWGAFKGITIGGKNIFDTLDFAASNILLPLGGLLIVVFVGWYMRNSDVKDEMSNNGLFKLRIYFIFRFLIRFIAPVAIAIIFLNAIGILRT